MNKTFSAERIDAPGESRIIAAATTAHPRQSEAAAIELTDGRLLVAWGQKSGGDDFSEAAIVGMYSNDGGKTWDGTPHVVQAVWDGVIDVISPNFFRTPRGIHLILIGRNPAPEGAPVHESLSQIYQSVSTDEGETWTHPEPITKRIGYHIINNARVIRTTNGRIIAPLAYTPGPIYDHYDRQLIYCLYSDDDGMNWAASDDLKLSDAALMEPGIAECADGSLYMTIRTKLGYLYQARSYEEGASWVELGQSTIPSAEAPATVVRDPQSSDLWIFWCNTPYTGRWFERHDIAFAASSDNGATWSPPVTLEHDRTRSYGYVSWNVTGENVLLTYYDWKLSAGEPLADGSFHMTHLRQRLIPLAWFRQHLQLAIAV